MYTNLLIIAAIIFICILLNKISGKIGMPMLLAFILLGMFFGSDGIVKIPFENYEAAEKICSIALIFIMFYGGFGTKWSTAKPVVVKAVLLSSLGVILTAFITGLFCWLVLGFDILESFLIGSVIGSTDAASVFSILRSKRLNLKDNTAPMLEIESGSNDPFSYMLTIIILSVMNSSVDGKQVAYLIFSQITYGILFGVVIAIATSWILKKYKFSSDGFDTIFVLAIALLAYAAPSYVGGNGYLSVYIVGIVLGNSQIHNKKSLVHFFDGITGLMQILIFFLLGLLSFPSQIPSILLPALAIALFLTFVARPIAVFSILSPFKCSIRQQLVVSWAGFRGAASIVFAIMATVSPAYMKNDIFHIVFCIVLFSISLQGSLIPYISKKLGMIDDNSNVLKTFNDYSEEVPIGFIKLTISQTHPWIKKCIRDISLPPDTLLALIIRGEERFAPKGNTIIQPDDTLVLCAQSFGDDSEMMLTETRIDAGHEWIGLSISEITLEPDKIIIIIKRAEHVVIPRGRTIVKEDDILVFNHSW